MANSDNVVMAQLATRIPKDLLQKVKRFCVDKDITVMAFVTAQLEAGLKKK
jgi:cell division protein FtsI/penicillin-binding protein 2